MWRHATRVRTAVLSARGPGAQQPPPTMLQGAADGQRHVMSYVLSADSDVSVGSVVHTCVVFSTLFTMQDPFGQINPLYDVPVVDKMSVPPQKVAFTLPNGVKQHFLATTLM